MNTITRRSFMQCISLGVAGIGFGFVWPRATEAEVPWAKIMSIVSDIGTTAQTTKDVVDAIQAVKGLLPQAGSAPQTAPAGVTSQHMQMFHSQMPDAYAGGNQWLSGLQSVAAQYGNSWVPSRTQGFLDINLTGVWGHPQNLNDQTYIRQFGPYLNVIAGIGGVPTFLAEGLFDPMNNIMHVLGLCRGEFDIPCELRARINTDWTLQGLLTGQGPFGQIVQMPIAMMKIA
ncbi:MAG: hypothetical protein CV088_09605 [Nitrospira sp. LK70]|nr:hypothetical protein [Nitrospira sp. LK70]